MATRSGKGVDEGDPAAGETKLTLSRMFWYHLERFVFARSKPDWLTIPDHIEVYHAMPGR